MPTAVSDPNPLEVNIMDRADPGTEWFRTGSGNEAFTLAYGKFKIIDWDFESEECFPDNSMPCCWSDTIIDRMKEDGTYTATDTGSDSDSDVKPLATFEGTCLYVIHSGNYSERSHHFIVGKDGKYRNPTMEEQYGDSLDEVDADAKTKETRSTLWARYIGLPDNYRSISLDSYTDLIRPEFLAGLEKKFDLADGKWFLLPSDCFFCT